MFKNMLNTIKRGWTALKAFVCAIPSVIKSEATYVVAGTEEFVDVVEAESAETTKKILKTTAVIAGGLISIVIVCTFPITILLVIEVVVVYRILSSLGKALISSIRDQQ